MHHGYGFDLTWSHMEEGIHQVEEVFEPLRVRVEDYLLNLP